MRKLNLAIALLAGAAVLTGCALGKMIKLAADQDLQVNPNPLEVHGGNVSFEMSAVLPPKMLPSGKVYTINSIYQYGDDEVAVGSIEFKAEDFPNSSSSTSRKSENFSFPYQEGMNPGTLYVEGVASDPNNGKSKSTARMAAAQGLITTSFFAKSIATPVYADHGYNDKEEITPTNVDFYFEQGVSRLNPSISTGGKSNREKSNTLAAFIADKNLTRTVTITGTHSPEGPERINRNLSQERAKAIEDFYRKQMRRYDYKGMADSIKFILKPVVEDWSAFSKALDSYEGITAQQKTDVKRIISGTGTFEDKEKNLQKLDYYSKLLKDVYPGLRSAKTEILTVKDKKSNAEIAVIAKQIVNGEDPTDSLSDAELLFSATLTPSLDEKEAIYKEATKRGSWAAHNNLGAVYLAKAAAGGDKSLIENAMTQLEIAQNKNSEAAAVYANIAAAYIMQGDIEKAQDAITSAESASPSNDVNGKIMAMKGSIQLKSGDYEAAKASFLAAEETEVVGFDRGLTYLLNKEFSEADKIFTGVSSSEDFSAEAYYLRAVTAARQNDAAGVTSNLKEAVSKDPALKDKALNDLEFTNFASAVAEAVR